jgi:hypothetical protein
MRFFGSRRGEGERGGISRFARNDGQGGPRRAKRLRTERLRWPKRGGSSSHNVRAMGRWFSLRGGEGEGFLTTQADTFAGANVKRKSVGLLRSN